VTSYQLGLDRTGSRSVRLTAPCAGAGTAGSRPKREVGSEEIAASFLPFAACVRLTDGDA
jgi:hypothetical protein